MKTRMLTTILLIAIMVSGTSMAEGPWQIKPRDPIPLPGSAINNLTPIPMATGVEIVNDTGHLVITLTISDAWGHLVYSAAAQNLVDRGASLFVDLAPGEYTVSIGVLEDNVDPHWGWFNTLVLRGRTPRL